MTISVYQADNVIKAYNKQQSNKTRFRLDAQQNVSPDKYADVVMLSGSDVLRADANKKISYNLLDVLLKDKKVAL
jgi:hypothetical protein